MQFEKKIKGKPTTVKIELMKDEVQGRTNYVVKYERDGDKRALMLDGHKVALEIETLIRNMVSNEILRQVNAK